MWRGSRRSTPRNGIRPRGTRRCKPGSLAAFRRLNQLGSLAPGLANWLGKLPLVRNSLNRVLGLAPERSLPLFAPSLYRWFARRAMPQDSATRPRVVLFADCFVTYNEPEIRAPGGRRTRGLGIRGGAAQGRLLRPRYDFQRPAPRGHPRGR